jgi:hypothetical protein
MKCNAFGQVYIVVTLGLGERQSKWLLIGTFALRESNNLDKVFVCMILRLKVKICIEPVIVFIHCNRWLYLFMRLL